MNYKPLEYEIGDHIFLKISSARGIIRFGSKGKFSPRYIGSFEVLERVGMVAFRLTLSPFLAGVHNVFPVLQLRKYVADDSYKLDHSELKLRPDLTYEVQPVSIVNQEENIMKNKVISLVRVS